MDAAADREQRRKVAKHAADGQRARAPLAYAKLPVAALLHSPAVAQLVAEAQAVPGSSRLGSYSGSLATAAAEQLAAGRPIAVAAAVAEQGEASQLR